MENGQLKTNLTQHLSHHWLLTEEKAAYFRKGRQQHGRSHFTYDATDVRVVRLIRTTRFTLVCLNQNKNVVNTDSQYQERYNLQLQFNVIRVASIII